MCYHFIDTVAFIVFRRDNLKGHKSMLIIQQSELPEVA
jgi:hypothetical protein